MYALAQRVFRYNGSRVLHIVHPKEKKSNDMNTVTSMIDGITSQTVCPGIDLITEARFDYFDTVVIHSVSQDNYDDWCKRITADPWKRRLKEVAHDPGKMLIIFGSSVTLAGPKIIKMPSQLHMFLTPITKSLRIDLDTDGLGITKYRIDTDYNEKSKNKQYLSSIELLSKSEPILLFDNNTIYTSNGTLKNGAAYLASGGRVKKIADLDRYLSIGESHKMQQRKIAPIRAIYEDEEDTTAKSKTDAATPEKVKTKK